MHSWAGGSPLVRVAAAVVKPFIIIIRLYTGMGSNPMISNISTLWLLNVQTELPYIRFKQHKNTAINPQENDVIWALAARWFFWGNLSSKCPPILGGGFPGLPFPLFRLILGVISAFRHGFYPHFRFRLLFFSNLIFLTNWRLNALKLQPKIAKWPLFSSIYQSKQCQRQWHFQQHNTLFYNTYGENSFEIEV